MKVFLLLVHIQNPSVKLDAATTRLANNKRSTPNFIDFNHPEFSVPASRLLNWKEPRCPDCLRALFQPRKHRFKAKKQPCFYCNPLTGLDLAWSDPLSLIGFNHGLFLSVYLPWANKDHPINFAERLIFVPAKSLEIGHFSLAL